MTRAISLLLLLISFETRAQVVQWSNPVRLKGTAIFTKVIGENEQGVYLMRYRNKFFSRSIIIDKYRHHLAFENSRSVDLRNSRLVKVELTQKGILLIKSAFNRKLQSNTLSAQYYDFDLKPIGEEISMHNSPVQELGDRGNFRVRISEDESKLALINVHKSTNETVVLTWALYNIDFKLLHQKQVELPQSYENFYLKDFLVNNQGKIALLSMELEEENRRLRFHKQRLFIFDEGDMTDYYIHDSLDIKEISIEFDRSANSVILAGFYGSASIRGMEGIIVTRYHFDFDHISQTISKFDRELVAEMKFRDKDPERIPEGFEFIKLAPRSDGGLLCVAEQKEVATESDIIMVNGIPQSTSKNIYTFNDILVLNLDSSGQIEWSHVVHKNQTTVNDGGYFSSAIVFVSDNFIQLIYNDQIRNSGDVMQYTLYSNGKVMSRKLLKAELDYVIVIPPESRQVSSNKMIISTSKNRRFALLKLIYD